MDISRRNILKMIAAGTASTVLPSGIIMPVKEIIKPETSIATAETAWQTGWYYRPHFDDYVMFTARNMLDGTTWCRSTVLYYRPSPVELENHKALTKKLRYHG